MKKMIYRILAAVCCLAMLVSFAGCGEAKENETVTAHEVIVTDIANGRIVVANLDLEDPFAKENLIWEFVPTEATL